MKHKFVFATNNAHKLEEVTAILGNRIELLSLKDIHCHTDIPETADTLEGNALLKAQYIYENYQMDCFADDTGLEVEALNGEPGVYSARYAGKEHLFEGVIKGEIIKTRKGNSGFGYDPIFVPEGYTQTFAEMGNELKNKISHRAIATNKLCKFLNSIQ